MLDSFLDTFFVDKINEAKALRFVIVIEWKHQHLNLSMLLENLIQLSLLQGLGNVLDEDACFSYNGSAIAFWMVLDRATGTYEVLLVHGKGAALLAVNLEEAEFFANIDVVLVRFALHLHECIHKFLVQILNNLWWLFKDNASALFKNLRHFLRRVFLARQVIQIHRVYLLIDHASNCVHFKILYLIYNIINQINNLYNQDFTTFCRIRIKYYNNYVQFLIENLYLLNFVYFQVFQGILQRKTTKLNSIDL